MARGGDSDVMSWLPRCLLLLALGVFTLNNKLGAGVSSLGYRPSWAMELEEGECEVPKVVAPTFLGGVIPLGTRIHKFSKISTSHSRWDHR